MRMAKSCLAVFDSILSRLPSFCGLVSFAPMRIVELEFFCSLSGSKGLFFCNRRCYTSCLLSDGKNNILSIGMRFDHLIDHGTDLGAYYGEHLISQ